jgi:hypothetical protein
MSIDERAPAAEGIDLRPIVSLLRRRSVILVLAAVAGGLAGCGIAGLTPPRYVGTARLALTAPIGTSAAAEDLARFRAALANPNVIRTAVSKAGVREVDPADVVDRVGSRTAGQELTVDVSWSDQDVARRLAASVAETVVAEVREQQFRDRQLSEQTQKAELDQAERVLATARDAWMEFNRRYVEIDKREQARKELSRLSVEIAAQRARIVTFRSGLARATADGTVEGTAGEERKPAAVTPPRRNTRTNEMTLAELLAVNEAELASLETRRDHVAKIANAGAKDQVPPDVARLQVVEAELKGDYGRALAARNVVVDAAQARGNQRSDLERRGEAAAQRLDRLTARSATLLGALASFVLALLAVILFEALTRRPAPVPERGPVG